MATYSIPGVYREEVQTPPRQTFGTGVPAFLGYSNGGAATVQPLTAWSHFTSIYSSELSHSIDSGNYLVPTIRGFFQNGGALCYVVNLGDQPLLETRLAEALQRLDSIDAVDLVCFPAAMKTPDKAIALQQQLIDWCDAGQERFAILDPLPDVKVDGVVNQWQELTGTNAALYYPWVIVPSVLGSGHSVAPPCGHIAGSFAQTDRDKGVFQAPANRALEGIYDLTHNLTNEEQMNLDPVGVVNCIRAFPGRGIRSWGARTINGQPQWRHINVRRLFLTLNRWLNFAMSSVAFEPNSYVLWARIRRTVSAYLGDLYRRGALAGSSPTQAFYVKCDFSTTPEYLRNSGQVVVEIGIAPVAPSEFIVVRIVYGAGELLISGEENSPGKEN
jgi:phage tail sheath protein FI